MCFDTSTEIDTPLGDEQARLAGEMQRDFEARFSPGERQLIDYSMDDSLPGKNAKEAGIRAGIQFDIAQGTADDQLKRQGIQLTPAQRKSLSTRRNLQKGIAVVGSSNDARTMTDESQKSIKNDLIQVGRGIRDTSDSNLSTAAGLEAQRNTNHAQAEAQHQNSIVGTAATVGSMLLLSDPKAKEGVSIRDTKKDLESVRGMKLKNWHYKGDKKAHGGPMADEVPKEMRGKEVSGMKTVDIGDRQTVTEGAVQEIAKRMDKLERTA